MSERMTITAPHSKEAEMMVLGCMLTNGIALTLSIDELDESDFYFKENKAVFQAAKNAFRQGKPVDVHLISLEMKNQNTLKTAGGIGYLATLAQYSATTAYVEEYIKIVKNRSALRKIIYAAEEIQKKAQTEVDNPHYLLEELQENFKALESDYGKKLPILPTQERLNQNERSLKEYRGKNYLGLKVKTIEEFNENLLGLRKLILLAAGPNVGKTALTIQLATEVLLTEPDACLAYFSLEMTAEDIFTRLCLYFSKMNFRTFVFGSEANSRAGKQEIFFSEEELIRLSEAEKQIQSLGKRAQIIDTSMCPYIDSRTVINYVEAIKRETGCKRAIVIIDYLQVWPINPNIKFMSENETDKWRIGEMKRIRDAMNNDPVIVISEARKPSGKEDLWGGDLSDVMGSARSTYTPDVVMLLSPLRPKTLSDLWENNHMPDVKISEELSMDEAEKAGLSIKKFLSNHGIAICKLEIPKARDGMHKFTILLEFHFHKNLFKKLNWDELKKAIGISQHKHMFG